MEAVLAYLGPVLEMAAGKYGLAAQILSYVAMARLFFKPVVSLAQAYVQVTPSVKDDEKLQKLMESKSYKSVAYLLDWFASLKLPQAKK